MNQNPIKISVVTPCFNSIHTIRETIQSVLNQNYRNYEHIIYDGGSTDGTIDVLKSFPHLIWTTEKDDGHYHAMNKGIERSSGGLVVILNADDCFLPHALRAVAAAFEQHPEWDATFGDVIYVDGNGREIYRREEAKFDYGVLRYCLNNICHHTLYVRKSTYQRLGAYRYKKFKNCCDYEFILRMGREKCIVGHVPKLLVRYRIHSNGQSADLRIVQNMNLESAALRKEHGKPDGALGKVIETAFRAKRQLQKLWYRGKCDLVRGSWRSRKLMQEKTNFSSNIGLDKL